MANEFSVKTSYWQDYKVKSIYMNDYNASCRLSVYSEDPSMAVISDLYVGVNERRKGLGSKLLDICIIIATNELNCRSIKLYSDKSWKMNWYVRRGFKEVYSCGDSVLLMKNLEEANPLPKSVPNLIGEDLAKGRYGYKMPDGYMFDGVSNGTIILKRKENI